MLMTRVIYVATQTCLFSVLSLIRCSFMVPFSK